MPLPVRHHLQKAKGLIIPTTLPHRKDHMALFDLLRDILWFKICEHGVTLGITSHRMSSGAKRSDPLGANPFAVSCQLFTTLSWRIEAPFGFARKQKLRVRTEADCGVARWVCFVKGWTS